MKKIVLFMLSVLVYCGYADERIDWLNKFEAERNLLEKKNEKAFTTVDITFAAGEAMNLSEAYLNVALDYKLRNVKDGNERLRLLADFAELNREIQKILDAAREGTGSIESCLRYSRIDNMQSRQIYIYLADKAAAARWKRISDAEGVLDGQKIEFRKGQGEFTAKMYDDEVVLYATLYIDKTFTFDGRDFALFNTDIAGSMNDDFATLYICEFKNGKIVNTHKCNTVFCLSLSVSELEKAKNSLEGVLGDKDLLPNLRENGEALLFRLSLKILALKYNAWLYFNNDN